MSIVKEKKIMEFLEEDIGSGDITSIAICRGERVHARIIAKEEFIVCGVDEAKGVFTALGVRGRGIRIVKKDGSRVYPGDTIMEIRGDAGQILSGERTALNLLMRMSGIATRTHIIKEQVARVNPHVKVSATRKTTPGFRWFEKHAVMVGGGHPHRYGLYDAVLIKDNHIRVASSITEAVARVRDAMRQGVIKRGPIEVETQALSEVREAVRAGVDIIMLDNFTPEMVKRARQLIPRSIMVEVSGGITESNIMKYAPYADIISMGALTSSYRSVDISLEIERVIGRSRMSSQSL